MSNLECLKSAWKGVAVEYSQGVINSERCMQAVMYHQLKIQPFLSGSIIYVEPTMCLTGNRRSYKPDLVVCSHGKVNMLIELKYKPHDYSEYKGDIEKLGKFGDPNASQSFDLIRPYMATSHSGEYAIHEGTQLVYAVISKFDSVAVDATDVAAAMPEELRQRFIHLYCKVTPGKNAEEVWNVAVGGVTDTLP